MKYPSQEFWKVFKETAGAFSTAEAIALYNICLEIRYSGIGEWGEDYLELGSHKGKSGMAAAAGLKTGRFYLVDPIYEDEVLAKEVESRVHAAANNLLAVYSIAGYSTDKIAQFRKLNYVFVDSGSHSDELPMQEAKMLEDKVVLNGVIAFHDKGSQFTKVDEAFEYLVRTGKYEPININWNEIFDYVKEHNLEEGNNSWHQYPDLPHAPNFVGALKRIK
jgi:hypothetical protein